MPLHWSQTNTQVLNPGLQGPTWLSSAGYLDSPEPSQHPFTALQVHFLGYMSSSLQLLSLTRRDYSVRWDIILSKKNLRSRTENWRSRFKVWDIQSGSLCWVSIFLSLIKKITLEGSMLWMCGGQRTMRWRWFFPTTVWVLDIELATGLVASALNHWTISPANFWSF